MKDTIIQMIEALDAHCRDVIQYALVGMTSGLGTTAEMVDALDDDELDALYYCLRGMLC